MYRWDSWDIDLVAGGKRPYYSEEEGETADRVTRQEILAAYPFHTPLRGKEKKSIYTFLLLSFSLSEVVAQSLEDVKMH